MEKLTVDDILKDRDAEHGNYKDAARIHTYICEYLRNERGWYSLDPSTKLAIEQIVHKIVRIVNRGKAQEDSLLDIAGYATLALQDVQEIREKKLGGKNNG